MRRRALLVNKRNLEINTIIGGIGGTINTRSLLASKLVIPESIIRKFEVVGSDVHCHINSGFRPTVGAFEDNSAITSYEDLDGRVLRQGSNLGNTTAMFKNSNIRNAYFPQSDFMTGMFWLSKIENLDTPNLSIIPNGFLRDVTSLINWNHSPITSIDNLGMMGCNLLINLDSVTSLGTQALFNVPYTNITMLSIVNIMGTTPFRSPSITSFFAPNLEYIQNANSFFNGWTSCNLIDVKKLKTYGTEPDGGETNNAKGFVNLKTGCVIKVHEDLATANAGSPHGALVWVKANRSATVEFYDDSGNYVSTL